MALVEPKNRPAANTTDLMAMFPWWALPGHKLNTRVKATRNLISHDELLKGFQLLGLWDKILYCAVV